MLRRFILLFFLHLRFIVSSRKEFHELIFSDYIFSYVCNTLKIIKQKIHFVHLQIHFNNINEHKKMFAYFCSINLLMMN